MDEIKIRCATLQDIPIIEFILLDAVTWLDDSQLHLWDRNEVCWSTLKKHYDIGEFYIASIGSIDVGCMVLIEHDPFIWPDVPAGSSLFIHKLAIKRIAAGKGVSNALIDYAKEYGVNSGVMELRLDCHQHRKKLRDVYERNGFVCVAEKRLLDKYDVAFYLYKSDITSNL